MSLSSTPLRRDVWQKTSRAEEDLLKLNEAHRFVYTIVDSCQFDILIKNNITSVSLQPKSLVNNSTTTITIATSLSLHNESALLNKICENMEKQRQKRVKCVCQLLRLVPNWSGAERFTRCWLCVCVCALSCHRNQLSASVQSTLLFLTSKPQYVSEKTLCFTGSDRDV